MCLAKLVKYCRTAVGTVDIGLSDSAAGDTVFDAAIDDEIEAIADGAVLVAIMN